MLRANQVRYAEVQVTPVRNRMAGIGFDELAQALTAGRGRTTSTCAATTFSG